VAFEIFGAIMPHGAISGKALTFSVKRNDPEGWVEPTGRANARSMTGSAIPINPFVET
jgi:hypothetical protein